MGSSSKSKNKGGDIIVQGSILAAAQIIVRLIGLFYRIPLQRISGDVAMGYYGYAYDIYMLLLLVSSNGVPLAVSKLVSKTHAKRDYTNEHRIMVSALLWTLVVGSVIGLGTFIFAKQITSAVFGPEMMGVVPALRVLAPTIFFCCVMSTFRGYFQGIGSMMPTAISQIFEQIFSSRSNPCIPGTCMGRHGRYPRYLYRCTCKHDFPDYYIYVVSSTVYASCTQG